MLAAGILPELARAAWVRGQHVVRAWSAGCASGEEPYSLRLAWDFAVEPALPHAALHVLATDVSPELLRRARWAVYPASALEELPDSWRSAAFEEVEGGYRLREEFRSGVEFQRQDIREAMPAGPIDLILCRNLAFTYFEIERQRAILTGLEKRLSTGGALLVGSHESLPEPTALVPSAGTPGLYRVPRAAPLPGPGTSLLRPADRE